MLMPEEMRWEGVVCFQDPQKDLDTIRAWALREEMISQEDQLITEETVEDVSRTFSSDDELSIAVHVTLATNTPGEYIYLEYPFMPMNTLARKGLEVEIVYWAMEPDPRRSVVHSDHNGVRFGFWVNNNGGSGFVSVSSGKIVAQKFEELARRLSTTYPTVGLGDWAILRVRQKSQST